VAKVLYGIIGDALSKLFHMVKTFQKKKNFKHETPAGLKTLNNKLNTTKIRTKTT
jgi:hypothetical protein